MRHPDDTITITRQQYFNLRLADLVLAHLEAEGVDNWQGYSYPVEEEDELRKEILGE